MRAKELADLTGTTVRTIRHYHHIGLLPVPPVTDGVRDYDLRHVARLTRIRWLARAGVPLSRVAGLIDAPTEEGDAELDRGGALADLTATLTGIEEQIGHLRTQRDRIRRLIAAVEHERTLSPLPAAVARFYATLEARATDDGQRRAIRHERHFMELAYFRGDMPPEAGVIYERIVSDTTLAESLVMFGTLADLGDPDAAPTDAQVAQVAAAVVERLRTQLGDDFAHLARSLDLELTRRAAALYLRLATPAERAVGGAAVEAIIDAITAERAS